MKKCSYCGRENEDGAAYCRECGTPAVEKIEDPGQTNPKLSIFAKASAMVGCVAAGTALVISLQFFAVGRGDSVRAMGWAAYVFMLATFGLVAGLPCGLVGLFSPRRWLALAGTVLSLAAWPLAVSILHLAATIKGFRLSP